MEAEQSVLTRVPLFAELEQRELIELNRCLRGKQFQKGEVIFLEGDPGTSLYIIESGRVRIVLTSAEGKEVLLTVLGPSDFFGDLALLDGEPRSADAVAQESGRLVLLQRDDFLRFVESHPRAATRLLAILSRRLRRNAQYLQDAAFLDIPGRLARLILQLADADGQVEPTGTVVRSRLTQTELASMVGSSRESVNKWLRAYQRQGLIRWQHGQITVLDRHGLRGLVESGT